MPFDPEPLNAAMAEIGAFNDPRTGEWIVPDNGERSRYEYDLLDLCGRIHGAFTGSGDGIPPGEAAKWCEWLTWRLGEGWETWEGEPHRGDAKYDRAVRELCVAALWELNRNGGWWCKECGEEPPGRHPDYPSLPGPLL